MLSTELFIVHAIYYKDPAKKRVLTAKVLSVWAERDKAEAYIAAQRGTCKSCPPRDYNIETMGISG